MRHVLLTTDSVGGVWTYSLELARGLLAHGYGATLAVLGPNPSQPQLQAANAIRGLQVIPTGLPLDWTAVDEAELRVVAANLAGLAGRLKVDRVHLHAPSLAAEAPWNVPVVAVAHSDVATWWQANHGGTLPDDLAWRAAATGRGLAEADAVIAPSVAFADALEGMYHPGRRIHVVHLGLAPFGQTTTPRERAVLTVGRLWDASKNIAMLDRIAPTLDAPVMAVGALVRPDGAEVAFPSLTCSGPLTVAELAEEYARATVFASPARYEPFGLAVLEAAQAGCALALADIPTFRELWHGVALFFHPQDDAGARDAIGRLLRAPEAASERARARAAEFSPAAMVDGTLMVHATVPDQARA